MLIVVAHIGRLRPIREGAPRLPFMATLLLANGYGRVLAVFDSGAQDGAALPPGVVDYGGKRTLAADMRKFILEYLGNNNVLVGFHFAWTLTALSLSVPASRAFDLGSKPVFQELCCRMAGDLPAWKDLIMERLTTSLDRRILAVLFRDGIDLYAKNLDDTIKEVNYTAAIWNIVAGSLAEHRSRLGDYRIKCAYFIGYGEGLTAEEEAPIQRRFALHERFRHLPIASMECAPASVLSMLQTAPVDKLTWPGEHASFIKMCIMVRE